MDVEEQAASDEATHAGLVVERVAEIDWERVKAVRLAALAESPSAFGSTLARERTYDEAAWRAWGREAATFLAVCNGVPMGIAAGVRGTLPDERKLIAMWVHPGHRGTGAASALLAAVRDWALRDGATSLTLWVTRGNQPATDLYRRAGFYETGVSRPLPSSPALTEDQLTLELR